MTSGERFACTCGAENAAKWAARREAMKVSLGGSWRGSWGEDAFVSRMLHELWGKYLYDADYAVDMWFGVTARTGEATLPPGETISVQGDRFEDCLVLILEQLRERFPDGRTFKDDDDEAGLRVNPPE